jgi:hypothetical protein
MDMPKSKDKPLTRAEVRKMIRRESTAIMKVLIQESMDKMSSKLEPAVGFKYVPIEEEDNENN